MSASIGFFKTLRADGSATSSKKLWLDNQKKMILGSHSSCDIRLRVHGASDNQASFELDIASGKVYIIHNGKPNTTLLGEKVLCAGERTLVKDGDIISYKDGITCRSFRFEYNPQRKSQKYRHENSENENPNSLQLRRRSLPTALQPSKATTKRIPLMARDSKTVQRPNNVLKKKTISGLKEIKGALFDSQTSNKSCSDECNSHVDKLHSNDNLVSNECPSSDPSQLNEQTMNQKLVENHDDDKGIEDTCLEEMVSPENCSDMKMPVLPATTDEKPVVTEVNAKDLDKISLDDGSDTNHIQLMVEKVVDVDKVDSNDNLVSNECPSSDPSQLLEQTMNQKLVENHNDTAGLEDTCLEEMVSPENCSDVKMSVLPATTDENPVVTEVNAKDLDKISLDDGSDTNHIQLMVEKLVDVDKVDSNDNLVSNECPSSDPSQLLEQTMNQKVVENRDDTAGIEDTRLEEMVSPENCSDVKMSVSPARTDENPVVTEVNAKDLDKISLDDGSATNNIQLMADKIVEDATFLAIKQHTGAVLKSKVKLQRKSVHQRQPHKRYNVSNFDKKNQNKFQDISLGIRQMHQKEMKLVESNVEVLVTKEAKQVKSIQRYSNPNNMSKMRHISHGIKERINQTLDMNMEQVEKNFNSTDVLGFKKGDKVCQKQNNVHITQRLMDKGNEREIVSLKNAKVERKAALEEAARVQREEEDERERLRKAEEERLAALEEAARVQREAEEERERLRKAEEERKAALEEAARVQREEEEERERLRKAEEERLAALEEAARVQREAEEERERLQKAEEERLAALEEAARVQREEEEERERLRKAEEERLAALEEAARTIPELQDEKNHQLQEGSNDSTKHFNEEELNNLKVVELRELCVRNQLPTKGLKKAQLVSLLKTFYHNSRTQDEDCSNIIQQGQLRSNETTFSEMNVNELRFFCEETGCQWKGLNKSEMIHLLESNENKSISATVEMIMADSSYSTMKVSELKEECFRRNIVTKGMKKADLIDALQKHDLQDIPQEPTSDDLIPNQSFSDMKVVELRAACKARGLSTAGTKASLIERLESYVSSEGT